MATTVIIPARNEQETIGAIVAAFQAHPETENNVWVGLDADTIDDTGNVALANGGVPVHTDQRGKGQVVHATLSLVHPLSPRIILCDGDYTGLTPSHVNQILGRSRGMVIGVPDWPDIEVPEHVINAWPRVSGFRCLPWGLIPDNAHGYLLETQLNLLAIKCRMPMPMVMMAGLKSPFQWPLAKKRMNELRRDQEWGTKNGVL